LRSNILIVMSLAALVCLATNASSFDDSTGKTADELLNNTEERYVPMDSRFPATPHESRDLASNKSNSLSDPMPQSLSSAKSNNPKESRASSTSAMTEGSSNSKSTTSQTAEKTADQTTAATASPSGSLDISGKWLLQLDGKEFELDLKQNSGAVFGTGNMIVGNTTSPVSVSGSIAGDKVRLDLVAPGDVNLYRLSITPGDTVSGSYSAYSPNGEPTTGKVSGSKS
jgi:hypothetical protein